MFAVALLPVTAYRQPSSKSLAKCGDFVPEREIKKKQYLQHFYGYGMVIDSVKKRLVPESNDVTTMKNSTKTLFATLAVLVFACGAFCPQAQAVRINGGISFGGGFTTDTGDVNTATAFTSF